MEYGDELSDARPTLLLLTAQPEGGYTVTSEVFPELLTEGDTLDEALWHAIDAFSCVMEMYYEEVCC
jgi:antitoxin HicB